jgi:hypothetical protein
MCIKNWNKDISINVCITRMCGVPNNDGGRGGLARKWSSGRRVQQWQVNLFGGDKKGIGEKGGCKRKIQCNGLLKKRSI